MIKKRSLVLSWVLLGLLTISACSTSKHVSPSVDLSAEKTVFVSSYYSEEETRHVGEVKRVFEKYGFSLVDSRDQANYELYFSVHGGAVVKAKIELMKSGELQLSTTSANVGFGTVVARRAAIASRVRAAINKCEQVLRELTKRSN